MGLSRNQRESARQLADYRKSAKAAERVNAKEREITKIASVQKNLAKVKSRTPSVPSSFHDRSFGERIARIAPKLLDSQEYACALDFVSRCHAFFLRPLDTWEPRGKGRDTLFRSLCEHLFSKYKTPPFLWSSFFDTDLNGLAVPPLQPVPPNMDSVRVPRLVPTAVILAGGGSFYEEVKSGRFSIPLTRKLCHEVLQTSVDYTFLQGIRLAQVKAVGGDLRLYRAWLKARGGQTHERQTEEFWATVLHWFAQNPMLDRIHVGPLCDYIADRRRDDLAFTMKGRSAAALLDSMNRWHENLGRQKIARATIYTPSGFRGAEFDWSHTRSDGSKCVDIWRVREILSLSDLAEEGRNQRHCVLSYSSSIERGTVSIWSMTHEDDAGNWHALTIEVVNQHKTVVQARGVCNRAATARELNVLKSWSDQNGLRVACY